jgi:N-glycosidase YbiA
MTDWNEAIEAAARAVEAERESFRDPAYAGGPLGAFGELFACDQIMKAIRAIPAPAAGAGDPEGARGFFDAVKGFSRDNGRYVQARIWPDGDWDVLDPDRESQSFGRLPVEQSGLERMAEREPGEGETSARLNRAPTRPEGDEPLVKQFWRNNWYGSDPGKGASIWTVNKHGANSEMIAHIGPDAAAHEAAKKIVAAHNSALNAALARPEGDEVVERVECHGLDTPERVCFYEQDFYVLSNFSAFSIKWAGLRFDTSEHLYHWLKFATSPDGRSARPTVADYILNAPSAHEAFKIAERNKNHRRADWDDVKVGFMRDILRAKVEQHEYVRRKLLATGDRELVENSWRDDFWGWGPNRDGQNMLGKLWMEVRAAIAAIGDR